MINFVLAGYEGGAPIAGVLLTKWQDAQLYSCQIQLLVLRHIGGADGSVFSIGDDWCTCIFVVVTRELEISFLGCTDCISFAFFLTLSISRPFRKKQRFHYSYVYLQGVILLSTGFRNL